MEARMGLKPFRIVAALTGAMLLASWVPSAAQRRGRPSFPGSSAEGLSPDPTSPRPIDAVDSVFMEELTWLELRDALHAGRTTALLPIGGIEQSGPYLVVGKHAYVIRATTEAIARKLGNALVAPTLSFVPQGGFDLPTGFMRYPGAMSVQPDTFKRLLADMATSLRVNGFEHIVVLSDHGGNTNLVRQVVDSLSAAWASLRATIHYVPEYYDYPELARWLEQQGVHQVDEHLHDDLIISSIVLTESRIALRADQRLAAGLFSINGVPLSPESRTMDLGRRAIEFRADATARAIRATLREATPRHP
jgi:creatinine amidohydrolase/Fe(II)-dependent formamide hydrolase-like protein